jgi:NAD(P)H-quinone oxidoreductase subunit 5
MVMLAALAPALYALTAVVSWFQPGSQPLKVIAAGKVAASMGIVLAALSALFVYDANVLVSQSLEFQGMGISLRLDALSVLIFSMINLIAFIVLRFSYNYLDGDERQGVFTGRLAATIAAVQLLVLSGNLGLLWLTWVFTSFLLHRLLKFYPERKRAVIAARKKFIAARLSDAFLLVAFILLYRQFGTGDLEAIITGMKNLGTASVPVYIELAALCIALSAILKSALFPTHSWLVEVMETPTPVSALLHAGLLNAGPFLVARMAFVVHGSSYSPAVLIFFGGFTALFASVAYLTQTSVKTALGYSSVSHMGFSLLMCGMGVYAAAMLHLVAHSFYKAHAFLSSGSAIDEIKATRVPLPDRRHSLWRMLGSTALAFGVFGGLAYLWGIHLTEAPAFFAVGAIMVMGVSLLLSKALDSYSSAEAILKTGLLAALVAIAFFSLETGMGSLLNVQVPAMSAPSLAVSVLIACLLLLFAGVIIIQMAASRTPSSPRWQKLAIHMRNGLYANAVFDRLVNALHSKNANPVGQELAIENQGLSHKKSV